LKLKPHDYSALLGLGIVLTEQANHASPEAADMLYGLADESFHAAELTHPLDHTVLNMWGIMLAYWAERKEGEEARSLLARACTKYEQALAINADFYEALHNLGGALLAQAANTSGSADELFGRAAEKFAAALEIKADVPDTLYLLGTALYDQGKGKIGPAADGLRALAAEKWGMAELLSPGSAAYEMATISALDCDEDKCRDWLERGRLCGTLPSKESLLSDPVFREMRDREWFKLLCLDNHG
jgi:tetratricopeptide (TPR) repeat protein